MLHILVWNGNAKHPCPAAESVRILSHPVTETAARHILLHRNDQSVGFTRFPDQLLVDRLHKAGVCQRTGKASLFQSLPHRKCNLHHTAHRQKHNILLLKQNLALPIDYRCSVLFQAVKGLPSRIADGNGPAKLHRKLDHIGKLPLILGRHHMHIRYGRQIRQIKQPLMRLPVASHKSCPVDAEYHGQILDTDIV